MAVSRVGRNLVGAMLWFAAASPASAATVTVAWDPNPEPNVTNYNVFVSTQPGVFVNGGPVGNRTDWTFTGLQDNVQYYFAVQAQSASGLSPLSQIGYVTPTMNAPTSEAARSDFSGDGKLDLLWENSSTNQLYYWALNGSAVVGASFLNPSTVAAGWKMSGSGDFNHDGKPDLLWHNQQSGQVVYWLMNGSFSYSGGFLSGPVNPAWQIASVRDFDSDGNPDIWWHNQTTGQMIVWYFDGLTVARTGTPSVGTIADTNWKLAGTADFTGDGKPDAIWHNIVTGELRMWTLNGISVVSSVNLNPAFVAPNWKVAAVGDAGGDGRPDIVWRHDSTGQLVMWQMVGTNQVSGDFLSIPSADPTWKIMAPK